MSARDNIDLERPAGKLEVIARLDDVPAGQVLSGPNGQFDIPETRRADVVLIGISPSQVIGLFSEETFGGALMFDTVEQARRKDVVVRPRAARREVIQLVYERAKEANASEVVDSTSIEKLISSIIDDAVFRKASDIHIETRDNHADVWFRINGERVFMSNMPFDTARGLGQVLYGVHADMATKEVGWNIHELSEGSIDWGTSNGERLQLRFSSSPTFPSGNFHIVIRLVSTRSQPRSLGSLGYSPRQLAAIDHLTNGSGGMVLMCGPTNSGKSTSLQSLIERVFEVRGRNTKVITVEDPVELVIPGACQISVGRRRAAREAGEASQFTQFLRGALRQDPDVVMVGEIRDTDSAGIACELALAGRKVFATLHTYSALWAFPRLREMGVRPDLLTQPGFIAGICYQKLLPTLCPHCALPHKMDPEESLLHAAVHAAAAGRAVKRRGLGCSKCDNTGIDGRTLASEIVIPDRKLLALVANGADNEAEAYWLEGGANPSKGDGIFTAHDHVVQKIVDGAIGVQDAINSFGIGESYEVLRARGAAQ